MRYVAAFLALLVALPVQAFGPYPYKEWRFVLEFRRMPMTPTCREKFGQGRFVQKKSGRNPAYELTGFPAASIVFCTLPNGGTFWFETIKWRIRQSGGSIDMYKAITTGARL